MVMERDVELLAGRCLWWDWAFAWVKWASIGDNESFVVL